MLPLGDPSEIGCAVSQCENLRLVGLKRDTGQALPKGKLQPLWRQGAQCSAFAESRAKSTDRRFLSLEIDQKAQRFTCSAKMPALRAYIYLAVACGIHVLCILHPR